MNIKNEVVGKWGGIIESLGIKVPLNGHGPCPICGCGDDRFRLDPDFNKTGGWYCNQCDPHAGDGWSLVMRSMNIDFKAAADKIALIIGGIPIGPIQNGRTYDADRMRKLYKYSHPTRKGDVVWKYLENRGLVGFRTPALRTHNVCWEPDTRAKYPAMLGIFTSPSDDAITIHRTFLNANSQKLDIKNPKKIMTPKTPMPGGAVRLYEWTGGPLGIAEGIETAIAVSIVRDIPVWAALSSTLLSAFRPPNGVTELEIYGDNDLNFTGQKAAYSLGNRIKMERNISVNVHIPFHDGNDWLDELKDEIGG